MYAVVRALTPLAVFAVLGPAARGSGGLGAQQPTPYRAPRAAPRPDSANPLAVPPSRDLPAVRVSLGADSYVPGDRARVGVRARAGGYLVVLHADPAGRVRVLFPLDPGDDQRVRGGADVVLRSRGGRDAFTVGSATGDGAVLAALAASPFRVAGLTTGDHWDLRAFPRVAAGRDAEGELVALVHRMLPRGHFDYDVATYRVSEGMPIVSYGNVGGAAGSEGQENEQYQQQGNTAAAGSYLADDYAYGYDYGSYGFGMPFYGGVFPVVTWGQPFSSCAFGFGGGFHASFGGFFPSCFSVGFFPHRFFPGFHHTGRFGHKGGFGHRRTGPIGRGWRDDLSFPGNPDFGDPRGVGRRRDGGRIVGVGVQPMGPRAHPGMGAPGIGRQGTARPGALPRSPDGGAIVYRTRPPSRTPTSGFRAPAPTPWVRDGGDATAAAAPAGGATRPRSGMNWTPMGRPAGAAGGGGGGGSPSGVGIAAPMGGPTVRAGGGPRGGPGAGPGGGAMGGAALGRGPAAPMGRPVAAPPAMGGRRH